MVAVANRSSADSNDWQVLEEVATGSPDEFHYQYVWGLMYIDEMVCRYRDADGDGTLEETRYVAQERNYTVTSLIDPGTGAVAVLFTMEDAYGAGLSSSGGHYFKFRHQGLYGDGESPLTYNRERMLHQGLGRPTTRDPLGYVDGANLYEYVRGNPVRHFDPHGQAITSIDGAIEACLRLPTRKERLSCLADLLDLEGMSDSMRKAIQDAINALKKARFVPKTKCGNCTPGEHAKLQKAVKHACNVKRACKSNHDLSTLRLYLNRNQACLKARITIIDRCFGGKPTDKGHQKQIHSIKNAIDTCTKLIQKKQSE